MSAQHESLGLSVGDTWQGFCPAHMGEAEFEITSTWLRDGLLCRVCGAIPRSRAVALVIENLIPHWREKRLWEIAPFGPTSERLRRDCADYTGSHYWPDLAPGEERHGFVCQDVEGTTFKDEAFDVVVSQDVFEHVLDVERGMIEINRVLTPGGVHVFTVPRQRHLQWSRPRVVRTDDGVHHLEEAEYHGNPVDESGSLVTYDWGLDLETVIERASGLTTTAVQLESRRLAILGEFLEVFVSHKPTTSPLP